LDQGVKSTLSFWAIIGFTWLVLVGFATTSAEFRAWVTSREHGHPHRQPAQREFPGVDPPIGSQVNLPQLDQRGDSIRTGNPDGRIPLAYLAHCSTCRQDAIAPELLPFNDFDLVVVVHSDQAAIDRVSKALPVNARVLMDGSGEIGKLINASAPPRYYLLSGALRMLEMERYIGQLPGFVKIEEREL
jgi:hypothetical protein